MRAYAYVALAAVVLGFAKWAHTAVYDSGYNAAVTKQSEAIQAAQDAAVAIAREQWENTVDLAAGNIVIEERIVEVERIVEREIPKIVERIVTVFPECNDLGDDFARLLNSQVNSGSSGPDSGSDVAAEPD